MFNRLPALARFLLALIAIDLVVLTAFRGAFWAAFHEALANASRADLLKALYLGFKFDLRLALLLACRSRCSVGSRLSIRRGGAPRESPGSGFSRLRTASCCCSTSWILDTMLTSGCG